jgi:exopolysaccharide production protein ExoZ
MNKNLLIIQFFRGFAAILVVIHHATLISQEKFGKSFISDIFSTGGVGVDFFFVLSGFILLFVHIKDIGKKEKSKSFFVKRFIRVYPIYWVVTLLCLPFFFLSVSDSKSFDGDYLYIIKSFLLFPQEKLPLLSVGWTLTHEIYFYLLLGICIYFWKSKLVRIIVFTIVIGSFYKAFFDFNSHWDYKYRTYQTFLDSNFYLSFLFSRFNIEFFLGCISALFIYLFISQKETLNNGKSNLSKSYFIFKNNFVPDKFIYLFIFHNNPIDIIGNKAKCFSWPLLQG